MIPRFRSGVFIKIAGVFYDIFTKRIYNHFKSLYYSILTALDCTIHNHEVGGSIPPLATTINLGLVRGFFVYPIEI
jgi:hypothetical protein